MNNNQQNQAMGVLGGLTGFTIVANMADGSNVIAIITDFNTALTTLQTLVGNGSLPTGFTNIISLLGNGTLPNSAANIIAAINSLPQVAFKKISDGTNNFDATSTTDTLGVEGANDITVSVDATTKKITISGLTLKNAISALPQVAFKFVKGDTGGSVQAGSSAATLEIVGDGVIATTYHGGKIKIDSSALPHASIGTVAGDNNTQITIDTATDTLKVYGDNGIATKADDINHVLMIDGVALENKIGDLSQLRTTAKTSLVDAINELYGML